MDAGIIIDEIKSVTKKWAKQRKREEREANARIRRREALTCAHRVTIKDAAYEVMESAYLQASANGTLPARPRQIYYRARPHVLVATGQDTLDGQYFSQTLLVNYMAENPETTATWDIAWDDRGHFAEPHTGRVIGLGTLAVREYLEAVDEAADDDLAIPAIATGFPTEGPDNRFGAILFIEKEGFMPLFEAVHLAERYDLAIMSSKGLSSTAARTLVDRLCGEHGVPLLVLHDFDKSGFSILGTLRRNTRRYTFDNEVEVIDLGLRLEDVRSYDLEAEYVSYGKSNPIPNLRENGVTDAEIQFLCSEPWPNYAGKRVELNAFTSEALIAWLEGKLKKHAIKKIVPTPDTLERAYRRAMAIATINKALTDLIAKGCQAAEAARLPVNIVKAVRNKLQENPALRWDTAIVDLLADANGKR
jgi:hypothetical protein